MTEISRREVLNNLIRFKENFLEMKSREKNGARIYRVLLNRNTGDMRFAQKIKQIERHISRAGMGIQNAEDWMDVRLIVAEEGGKTTFELRDRENRSIQPSQLKPLAWTIASETVEILNQRAKHIHAHGELLPEEAILQDLSSIHLAPPKEMIENLPGWAGSLSRIDAEHKLMHHPVGTYLLRDGDQITLSIAFHLSEANFEKAHPYLLTVVEIEDKITDILILRTKDGWGIYRDNPDLKDAPYHSFSSLDALLQSIKQIAKFPLQRKSA